MKYEVLVTGQPMQNFTSIESALDYAARHVYLPWTKGLEGLNILKLNKIFNYHYGFKEVQIIPKGNVNL